MPGGTTAAKGAPAITEEPGLVRGGIGIDDVDTAYTRRGEARGAIAAGEVELPVGRASARMKKRSWSVSCAITASCRWR